MSRGDLSFSIYCESNKILTIDMAAEKTGKAGEGGI